MGTGASTPTSSTVLRGNGTGTSTWDTIHLSSDVQGTLGTNNGGTGINSLGAGVAPFLASPTSGNLATAVTDETGSGPLAFGNTPTLTNPVIGNFTNAQHNHEGAAGGGQLNAANALLNGSVDFANLLSTIFSGQLTTYSNPGTAGGTNSFFYVNLGGIKLFWGITAGVVTGSAFSVTLPSGFFSSVQAGFVIPGPVSGTAAVYSTISTFTTSTINFNTSVGAGGGTFVWNILVIGN